MNEERFLKCIVDKHRRQILECINTGEKSVNEIVDLTKLEQTLVSFHLKALKNCGLVKNRRDGQKIMYKISHPGILNVLKYIKEQSLNITSLTPGEECE